MEKKPQTHDSDELFEKQIVMLRTFSRTVRSPKRNIVTARRSWRAKWERL